MTLRTTPWPHGAPCWPTLAVVDEARARAFYGAVLGWTYRDVGPRRHDWTLAETAEGAVVAGFGAMPDAGDPAWLLGFATTDVRVSAATVVNGGGSLLQPPHEVLDGAALAAVARSPGGARFALVQAATFAGATAVNAPGALVWEDASSDSPEADRTFYRALFGWQWRPEPEAGADYATFGEPDDPHGWGGLGPRDDGEAPSWCLYFGVESVDGVVDAAVTAGGGVLAGPSDTPWGRLARLQDPDGAVFAVMAPDWDALPDRSA